MVERAPEEERSGQSSTAVRRHHAVCKHLPHLPFVAYDATFGAAQEIEQARPLWVVEFVRRHNVSRGNRHGEHIVIDLDKWKKKDAQRISRYVDCCCWGQIILTRANAKCQGKTWL